MNMILALDTMGSRYSMLPSEVISRATTFDMVIMDAAMTYANHRQREASGELPQYSVEELMRIKESMKK